MLKFHTAAAGITLFGIIGNTLAFIGFQRQSKKTSTSVLFQALAVTDNCVLVTVAPWELLYNCHSFRNNYHCHGYKQLVFGHGYDIDYELAFAVAQYRVMRPIYEMSILGTVCVTILLAVTRMIAVCFPLHSSRICSISRIRVYLIGMTIFIITSNLCLSPALIPYRNRTVVDLGVN